MYVCLCNPFTDRDVKSALENPAVPNTPAQIYKSCSGGAGPQCGSCLCMVKDMIVEHQSASGVQKLIGDIPALSPAPAGTAALSE
ncbi:MAG: (2Fe-2S)-binding protein [Micavibrio sp.]